MRGKKEKTDSIAKERLKLMMESEPIDCEPDRMAQMKKEISEIVSRYFDVAPDGYDVKVILKQSKKRA